MLKAYDNGNKIQGHQSSAGWQYTGKNMHCIFNGSIDYEPKYYYSQYCWDDK